VKKKLFLKSQKFHLRIGHFYGICILSLLATFIIISCNKKEANLQDDLLVVNDITFHDGRLIFKDITSFINHQKWLIENQGNPQLIADKNKSLGLQSMTEYYLEGMKLDETDPKFTEYVAKYPSVFYKEICDNSTLYLLPHSKLLCYVANKDGIYQVGDQICRIAGNYIYQINNGDESKIDMLSLPKDQISDKDIKIFPSRSNDAKNDYGNRTRYFSNSKYRIVSSLREYTNGIAWWDDIITNPQKKTLGVWFRAQLNTKSANGNGYMACTGCTQTPISASYDEETGLSQDVIAFVGTQLNMELSYCPAYSRGQFQGQTIYVYWPDALDTTSPSFTEPNWDPAVDEPF
jgi:hypothetical protein